MLNCSGTRSESGFYHEGAVANFLLAAIESLYLNMDLRLIMCL